VLSIKIVPVPVIGPPAKPVPVFTCVTVPVAKDVARFAIACVVVLADVPDCTIGTISVPDKEVAAGKFGIVIFVIIS
jgi:hypothetical protein